MSQINKPLLIANWKMNPVTVAEVKSIGTAIKTAVKKFDHVDIVIAPPHIYITELNKILAKSPIALGAQNIHFDFKGAYTGEHSGPQLTDAGVSYVIIGHSERRAMGESDELIAKKITAAIKAKLVTVLCIGEKIRDTQGIFYTFIEEQIKSALHDIPKARLKDVVIAYEPIWAIGTGATATVADVNEMQLFIKKVITKHFDRNTAKKIKVIYGGSVNADNASDLFKNAGVSGFLVGGASLRPADFAKIGSFLN